MLLVLAAILGTVTFLGPFLADRRRNHTKLWVRGRRHPCHRRLPAAAIAAAAAIASLAAAAIAAALAAAALSASHHHRFVGGCLSPLYGWLFITPKFVGCLSP